MSKEIIETFYAAFQSQDAEKMGACYHEKATFHDPVFSNLNAEQTKSMWKMLLERAKGEIEIAYHSIIADQEKGECIWEAKYPFAKTGNQVHNIIRASMKFENDLIIEHRDHFSFWRWSSMALGTPGKLLGWSPYLKAKVKGMAMKSLSDYLKKP